MSNWLHNCWYDFCWSTVWASFTAAFSFRFEGGRNVPLKGPVLLVGNHQSFLDPPCIGIAVRRRLHYLARQTLFHHPLFGALLSSLNAVPVDQEGVAKEGLKEVLELLGKGEAVLMFPEGERSATAAMNALKPGVWLLIKRAMPLIVPVGISGAFDALPRGRPVPQFSPFFMPATKGAIAVSIGKPLDGKRFAAMPREKMLAELFDAIHKMKEQAEELRRKP